MNAGVWYIVAVGLAGSASADQSTVSIHVVVVTPKDFVADFLQSKCDFRLKTVVLRLSPLWGLGAKYDDHLRLIGKSVVDFLLVLIELFFARCYG